MLGIIANEFVCVQGKSFPLTTVLAIEVEPEVDFRGNIALFFGGLSVGLGSVYCFPFPWLFYTLLLVAVGLIMYSVIYTRIRKVLKIHILNGGTYRKPLREQEWGKAQLLIDTFQKQKVTRNTTML